MVQTIYDLTLRIDLKIFPSYQDGEEQGKIGCLHRLFCELCQPIIEQKIRPIVPNPYLYLLPGTTPVLKEVTEKDLVQWALVMQKQGIPVERGIIIHKAQ